MDVIEETVTNDVIDTHSDNSEDNQQQEPEQNGSGAENKSQFATLEEANKAYVELRKLNGQQSTELGELRKKAQRVDELEQRFSNMQLREAQENGFNTVIEYQNSKELANHTADEYAKYINECDFPDEMEKLLAEYRKNPSDELLDTIESQFSVGTIKKVAGQSEIFKGQLQNKENEALLEELRLSATNYLNENVSKYKDEFNNPAFAALYGEAFRAYGCNLQTDRFVKLMRDYANSVIKTNGIKNGINNENVNDTDEIAGLYNSSVNTGSGSGKSLTEMSDKELDARLSQLI